AHQSRVEPVGPLLRAAIRGGLPDQPEHRGRGRDDPRAPRQPGSPDAGDPASRRPAPKLEDDDVKSSGYRPRYALRTLGSLAISCALPATTMRPFSSTDALCATSRARCTFCST